jgi:hypothetical protein
MIETNKQFEKRIRSYGIGKWFGRGIRLFDGDFELMPLVALYDGLVETSMAKLASEGLIPQRDYAENGADCDNWSFWIHSEVTKLWAKRHHGKKSFPAIAFGRCNVPGHELNLAFTERELVFWNYGQLTQWDASTINEVEFL